jgi:RimJ/RimL family protein N-acetyltransferase
MEFQEKKYKALQIQSYVQNSCRILPIRYEDRFDIMIWRNQQLFHLRQEKPLTKTDQENYFSNVVSQLFDQIHPTQILFSYLENDICIGYGGLVHINWKDKNAELSFLLKTELKDSMFNYHWNVFLDLIQKVAFNDLNMHKIFTYAFDVRPNLYAIFENAGFEREATLKDHCLINGEWKNIVIHCKIN